MGQPSYRVIAASFGATASARIMKCRGCNCRLNLLQGDDSDRRVCADCLRDRPELSSGLGFLSLLANAAWLPGANAAAAVCA